MMKWKALGSVALCTSLLVACSGKEEATTTTPATAAPSQSAPAQISKHTFTMLLESHASWPYNKDWPVWKWIEEKTGASFNVQLPSGTLSDTINLSMASGNMPDLTYFLSRADADKFGQQGALSNILEYKDIMPNLTAWLAKYPAIAKSALAADGKMYMLPNEGFGETNRVIWMYREDIFKKHNLKAPENYDELIAVGRKLKELYPKSYPFSFRSGANLVILNFASAQFGGTNGIFQDPKTGKARYGPTEDGYKKMVGYFQVMHKEGLIPPDWLTFNLQQWQNSVSNDQTFMILDYIGRLDLFNIPMQKTNPNFKLSFMAPPEGTSGNKVNPYIHFLESGLTVSSKSKKVKEAMKALDWYFTEEARTILSFGPGEEIYTTENGKRKLRAEYQDVTDLRKKTGLATNGAYSWFNYDAHLAPATQEQRDTYDLARKFDSFMPVKPQYIQSELSNVSLLQTAVEKHRNEQITRFILGERPMDQWDQYVSEANKIGVSELMKVAQTAYDRLK
ncbi:Lipoprotein LipO precursor [compost metagenome]